MFGSLKSLKTCTPLISHWLICQKTRNDVEVNVPRLSVLGLFGFRKMTYIPRRRVRFTWHFFICGGKRGKEKVEKWALMQEPASTTWWSIGRGTCMEVVRNRETHPGRSAAVKMIMASQITGPHLSSSNSLSSDTSLRLQQPTPSSSRVSIEPTRRNCPAAYWAGKAPPSTFK